MAFLKFCVVGGSGVVVDMGMLWCLLNQSGVVMPLALAKALACESAIINNFFWNDRWTFRGASATGRAGAWWQRFLWFNGISLAGLGLNVGLVQVQVSLLGANPYVANGVAIVLVAWFNYALSRRFGWRVVGAR